jgi:hypothetical protein
LKRETDIYFEIKEQREGRSVKYLTFYVFKNKKAKPSPQKELFVELNPKIEEKEYDYTMTVIEAFIKIGLKESDARKLYREGFNTIEEDEVRKEIVKKARTLDEYFFEKIDYTNFMVAKGDVTNPPGLLLTAIKQNYKSKEIEKNQKIKTVRKKRDELDKLKKVNKKKLTEIARTISEKEDTVVKDLYAEDENFFEKLLEGEYPELWLGYDNSKTLSENCLTTSGTFKAKVKMKVKEKFPDRFGLIDTDIEQYKKLKKEIQLM